MLVNEQNIEGGGRKGLHVTWSGEKIMWLLALAAGPGACRAVRNESGLGIRTNEFAYRPSVNSLNPHAGRCREAPLLKVVLSSRQGQNYAIMPRFFSLRCILYGCDRLTYLFLLILFSRE